MYIIYPAKFVKRENGYEVFFPDFDNAETCGGNLEEAYLLAGDLLGRLFEQYNNAGEPLPAPSAVTTVETSDICFFSLVGADTAVYGHRFAPAEARAGEGPWGEICD